MAEDSLLVWQVINKLVLASGTHLHDLEVLRCLEDLADHGGQLVLFNVVVCLASRIFRVGLRVKRVLVAENFISIDFDFDFQRHFTVVVR